MSYLSFVDNIEKTPNIVKDNIDITSKEIIDKLLREYSGYSKKKHDALINDYNIASQYNNIFLSTPNTPSNLSIITFFLGASFLTYKIRQNNAPCNTLDNNTTNNKLLLKSSSSEESLSSNVDVIENEHFISSAPNGSKTNRKNIFSYLKFY